MDQERAERELLGVPMDCHLIQRQQYPRTTRDAGPSLQTTMGSKPHVSSAWLLQKVGSVSITVMAQSFSAVGNPCSWSGSPWLSAIEVESRSKSSRMSDTAVRQPQEDTDSRRSLRVPAAESTRRHSRQKTLVEPQWRTSKVHRQVSDIEAKMSVKQQTR